MTVIVEPDDSPAISRLLYPERQRCLKCRKFFAFIVIRRLWCSYECADMPTPSEDMVMWPREHRTRRFLRKKAYLHPGEVDEKRHNKDVICVYLCSYCGMYHLGHS